MNRTASVLSWLLGEAILLAAFLYFGTNVAQSILLVNAAVSSIIWTVFMMCLFRNPQEHLKRGVGNGMKWFFTLTYGGMALGTMLYFYYLNPVDLLTQIVVQLIFVSVLLLGMLGTFKPARKTETNSKYLKMEHNQLMMMRNVIGVARTRADRRAELPSEIRQDIAYLQEESARMVPRNEYVALKMEGRIMLEMNEILACLKMQVVDLKRLRYALKHCGKLMAEYRDTYPEIQYGGL
jgi:small-conductance mechanosensitive channel